MIHYTATIIFQLQFSLVLCSQDTKAHSIGSGDSDLLLLFCNLIPHSSWLVWMDQHECFM